MDKRHGRARDLFTLWFGANVTIPTMVTGALATLSFKLPLAAAIVAIALGNMAGGVFMALHAAQGPQLGVPQMVQSRGQFGSLGSVLIIALTIIMYLGFAATNLVLGAQSFSSIAPWLDNRSGILIVAFVGLIASIYGYDIIHACTRWITWLCGIALFISFAWLWGVIGLPDGLWKRGLFTLSGFLGMLSVGAVWQISYAPYVSDYSRYLPANSGAKPAFWSSYLGSVLGSVLPMILGALLSLTFVDGDIAAGLMKATRPIGAIIIITFSIALCAASSLNIYCCVLSSITAGQTFASDWRPKSRTRALLCLIFTILSWALATSGEKNFLANYQAFLDVLLCVMAPWTAINLVDFYFLQHGRYDVSAFFAKGGGIYGRCNFVALFCFLFGVFVQIPFLSTKIYIGPALHILGGADISWLIGLAASGPLYYVLAVLSGRTDLAAQ